MGERFPNMGMRALLAKFPHATHVIQLRVIAKNGDSVSVEGAISKERATEILAHAIKGDGS